MALSPSRFWTSIQNLIDTSVARISPVRASVTALSSGKVQVLRVGNDVADSEQLARIEGFSFAVNDEVLCLQHNGRLVPIGVLQNAIPAAYNLDAPLVVAGAGTFSSLDVSGAASFGSINTPIQAFNTQSSSTTASTTDTVNYSDAISVTLTLGAGTWTIRSVGGVGLIHSASGTGRVLISTNAVDGSATVTPALATAGYTACWASDLVTGVAGNVSITNKVRFRCGTAGTTTAANPWITMYAHRTS